MIETNNLKFTYDHSNHFSFPDVMCKKSEVLLISGKSGVGKTTFLHLLGGLLEVEKGSVVIDNQFISLMTQKEIDRFRRQNIGVILQQNHFVESLSVLENVVLSIWLSSGQNKVNDAKKILTHLGLENQMRKLPSQLSIGQQQRVSIARAIVNNPKVILADEPTSSLDDENAMIVADLLENLAKEYNSALIIVTHDTRLKDRFSNQVTLL
ncbi:MAG: ATP-binding cassette domain-containing protein [Limnohabitans sp.]|nr:ATP-binding cassette domain-containing protein [Limnohabitans sp.]